MSIRRLFWLGAAILFSIAALVAIAAVLGAHFGETQWRILATCGIAFVFGAAALAGLACVDRGLIVPIGWAAVVLGVLSIAVWSGAVWQHDAGDGYWRAAGVLGTWTIAAFIATSLRLVVSSRRVLATVVLATWVAAALAAVVGTSMIVGRSGHLWKLELVLVILTALGYGLTPALQRFWTDSSEASESERLLGTLGNVEILAVRGEGRTVKIGTNRMRLDSSEGIVLRERA